MTIAAERFKGWISLDLTLLLPSVIAGLVTGLIGVIRGISYAALIYAGPLSEHLAQGVGVTVFSGGIIAISVALTSSRLGMIASPLTAPTILIALMANAIALQTMGQPESTLMTVMVAIVLTSGLTGTLLLSLGVFRWGDKIRLIPYPVVGGFMAGTGWLLLKGFVQVVTDRSLTWQTLPQLLELQTLSHLGVGVGFTLILLLIAGRFKHYLVMPSTLIALMAVFYVALWGTGLSLSEARDIGWLLGPFPEGGLWEPFPWTHLGEVLGQVQGVVLLKQVGSMISVAFVTLLSLILSNSGIELAIGQDLDLNQELRSLGIANLLSGVGGGIVGSQALPSTILVHEIGGQSRLTGLVAAIPATAVLLLGSGFLSYLPKPLLGCLLLYLSVNLLFKWLYQSWFRLSLMDYLTIVVIVVAINIWGFLGGILVGFILAVLLFMYHYSQVNVAKEVLSGSTTHSNRERSPSEQQLLQRRGEQILILELQGFLFFGTANYLLNQVKQRIADPETPAPNAEIRSDRAQPLRFVVLDFRQVTGIDASAVLSCSKILKLAHQHQFTLVFTNVSEEFQATLQRGQAIELSTDHCELFPRTGCLVLSDIDRGLEWCENQLLAQAAPSLPTMQTKALIKHLYAWELTLEQANQLKALLKPRYVAAQQPIYATDTSDTQLYILESGRVNVVLDLPEGNTKRLQTREPGAILGEMRFYNKPPLSTTVIAETDCVLQGLTQAAFGQLCQEHPAIAALIERQIIQLLCDSLVRREQQLRITR